jgi:guanylate kinase
LDIDIQGGEKIYNNKIDCNFFFIDAPSMATLEERLTKRGTEAK